jgi:hypothetical protein
MVLAVISEGGRSMASFRILAVFLLVGFVGCGTSGTDPDRRATAGSSGAPGVPGGAGGKSGASGASDGGAASGEGGRDREAYGGAGPGAEPVSSGTVVNVSVPQGSGIDALNGELDALSTLDADGILARHPMPFVTTLGYDPLAAARLDDIQQSALALDSSEQAVLGSHGFVISGRQQFPSFVHGYAAIYEEHLPLYVSADAILNAVHRSYDDILKSIERIWLQLHKVLYPRRLQLLQGRLLRLI